MSLKLKKVIYSGSTSVTTQGPLKYTTGIVPQSVRDETSAYPGMYHWGPAGNPALNKWAGTLPIVGFLTLNAGGFAYDFPPMYTWANFRSNPNYWKIVPYADSNLSNTYMARSVKYLEVQNSSNTVGWPGPKGTRVGGLALTKSKPPINRPKEPIYLKPKLISVRKPVRAPGVVLRINPPSRFSGERYADYLVRLDSWSFAKKRKEDRLTFLAERKFLRLSRKYKVDLAINESRTRKAKELFSRALKNYQVRLIRYNESVKRSKELAYRKVQIHPAGIPQDNPYGHIIMSFTRVPEYFSVWGDTIYATPQNINAAAANGLMGTPAWYDFFNTAFLTYEVRALDSSTPVTNLVQYGESVRLLILSSIDPFLVQHDEKLRRKIHQKLKNQTVHIGNIIAERKQTMDLVQSSVKRILELIRVKKNIFKTAALYAKNSKQIASDILAFKFGVEPLMNDIQSFARYLDTSTDEPIVTVRVNTGSAKSLPLTIETPSFTFTGFVEISYTVKCIVDNPASRTLSEFGLINPLEILWEVTPWSFVIDWFFPVGDWISNKTADCGLVFKTGTRKVKLVGSFTTSGSQTGLPLDPLEATNAKSILVDFDGQVIGRTVLTNIPNLPPIRLKNPLSWSHGIESVALLVQKLKIR